MRHIDSQLARELFDYGPLVESLRSQHRSVAPSVDDLYMEQPSGEGLLIRAAWRAGNRLGAKLASVFPRNPDSGLPSVHGVYVLFDGTNGTPIATIDGTWLTWFKTACDSALGASYLAREDAETLVMVGAGAMAPHLIRAHLTARPSIRRVLIWNRTASRAADVRQNLEVGADVEVADDLEAVCRTGDVISVATMSTTPLVAGDWLQPGTHLDLVGAYTPSMREADDVAMTRADVYVDLRETTVDAIGELMIPIAAGVIQPSDVRGDLFELCSGRVPGRTSSDQITLFKNGGGGHLDLMTASFALDRLDQD